MQGEMMEPFLSRDGRQLSPLSYAFLALLCFAFFVPGIASLPPIDRDEPLFAQATKQMIETNNFVDIRFQSKERYKKPIGIYWLQAASVKLFNPNHLDEIWAYRIPSLIGATVAVLMTAAIGCLLFTPAVGFWAAVMMTSCLVLNAEARLAKTDASLLATIVIAQYALARAYLGKVSDWKIPLVFWTALAFGFLIKGPIILLIVGSTLFWLWRKDRRLFWLSALKPRIGIIYTALLISPWFIAITIASHGSFLAQSAGHDMIAKMWEGQDRGVMPPGLHLVLFIVMFFPFSLFSILSTPDTWANRRNQSVGFCLGWIIPAWIVFELSLTKLPHYVMPMYPAIALLTAKTVLEGFPILAKKNRKWLITPAISVWLLIGTALATGIVILPYLIDKKCNPYAIAGAAAFLIIQGVCLYYLFARDNMRSLATMSIGSLIFFSATFGATIPNLQHFWLSREIVRVAEQIKPCEKLQLISAPYDEPSLIFLAGTNTILQLNGGSAAAELIHNPCAVVALDKNRIEPFLNGYGEALEQAHPVAVLENYSLGNFFWREITFYTMPQHVNAEATHG
jgi:4-amino-4-deoxy-L-arabinose transferase-like glycosyltransferase